MTVEEIAASLEGTCDAPPELEHHVYEQLSEHVFWCECCGWWFVVEEMEGECLCGDCVDHA